MPDPISIDPTQLKVLFGAAALVVALACNVEAEAAFKILVERAGHRRVRLSSLCLEVLGHGNVPALVQQEMRNLGHPSETRWCWGGEPVPAQRW